ncbi:NfeD family protein [Pseudomonas sp. KNUC1026]|uniref:NfeD family protein n=1 Tax=Pseudomonas sp. KNUC1026 TaxID=2893890 RepID=UPI001F3E6C37|nr:NfeD family protein [Pseudomonas sp. KNUC1026]UFH49333.1 NfeD family protein [Pseudomonas sp. KNUC1026]
MDVTWHYWLVFGLALAVLEIFTGTFALLCFGIGAALVSLVLLLIPSLALWACLLIWLMLSAPIFAGFLWRARNKPADKRWTADEALGEVGLLTVAADAFEKGRVRFQKPILGSDEWPCVADIPIRAGERVRVTAVLGGAMRVEPLSPASSKGLTP